MISSMIVYGYNINDAIEYRIEFGLANNFRTGKMLRLKKTNKRLFEFLLENSKNGWVSDEDLYNFVFESVGLKSSASRLRGALNNLKINLEDIGFYYNFISRNNKGYCIIFDRVDTLFITDATLNP